MIRMVRLGELAKEKDLTVDQKITVLDLACKELGIALAMTSNDELSMAATYLLSSPLKLTAGGVVLVPVEDGTPAW